MLMKGQPAMSLYQKWMLSYVKIRLLIWPISLPHIYWNICRLHNGGQPAEVRNAPEKILVQVSRN